MTRLKIKNYIWKVLGLIILLVIVTNVFFPSNKTRKTPVESNYAITSRAPFNQVDYYSLKQTVSQEIYHTTGTWVGRLILPTKEEISANPVSDWVWMEVYHAADTEKDLIGKKVIVTWQNNPEIEAYVKLVTTDIKFTAVAEQGLLEGNVLPIRLNGRSQVGPLQSLAGARPKDDVIVSLEEVKVIKNQENKTTLQIATNPLQITGRFYGLVKIIGPSSSQEIPSSCPGAPPCPSQLYQVIHYNQKSGQFDGITEIIRIPQQPLTGNGRYNSTPRQIESSPANEAGWYIYGDTDQKGIFTVQAIKPRIAFQLKPNRLVLGEKAGLNYINVEHWQNTPEKKGKLEQVFINPTDNQKRSTWKEGDVALVIHVFGGIGGEKGELGFLKFPTGHMSYGLARVVREPLTGELQFDIQYQQVYAHNPDGIIAGRTSWETFLGNLQRGWLGTRPISDVIVNLSWLNNYLSQKAGIVPFKEFLLQTEVVMARYRTGDGTGIAVVSPGTSCVQDSTQALYIAMQRIKQRLQSHPLVSNTQESLNFISFVDDLQDKIAPFGIIRTDWQKNAKIISGINHPEQFFRMENLSAGLLSWQSMIPRRAADEMSRIFLEHGSSLTYINTYQVGGWQPDIFPVAPTLINGLPFISTFLTRLILAFKTPTTASTWWITVQFALIYALFALPIGLSSGFLRWSPSRQRPMAQIWAIFSAFFFPGLSEEICFRVLLIPHRLERVTEINWLFWAIFSLILFVLYHPANAVTFFSQGKATFFNPIFLLLATLLGIVCTITYALTGSIWPGVIIHWLAVVVWLFLLGGRGRLAY